MSLKSTILAYLRAEYPRVVHKGEIGRKAILEWGYENENAGRRCRDLVKEKKIRKIPNEKHEAQYQYIGFAGSFPPLPPAREANQEAKAETKIKGTTLGI